MSLEMLVEESPNEIDNEQGIYFEYSRSNELRDNMSLYSTYPHYLCLVDSVEIKYHLPLDSSGI